jgi:hypothetical protein
VGQAGTPLPPEPSADQQVQAPVVLDAVQGGWSVPVEELKKKSLERTDGMSGQMQLDQIRVERNAALARNQGTLPPTDQARLVDLAMDLNAAVPNTFEAHMANFYVQFPAPSAFQELDLASARDRQREELVAPQLVNAARKDDPTELAKRAKDMKVRGKIAPGLYKIAEDIMASVEPSAILFAAGEMDAYPLWVGQFADGKRKDLLVVDQRLLVDPAYRMRIWGHAKATGPSPGEAGFISSLAAATERPVFVSLALGRAVLEPLKNKLYVTGLAMRLSATPIDNIPILESRWDRLRKPMDAGPLSRNYLVPGAVLLEHYRTIGDEARAARLEFELREMAKRLGATSALIKSGVLAH